PASRQRSGEQHGRASGKLGRHGAASEGRGCVRSRAGAGAGITRNAVLSGGAASGDANRSARLTRAWRGPEIRPRLHARPCLGQEVRRSAAGTQSLWRHRRLRRSWPARGGGAGGLQEHRTRHRRSRGVRPGARGSNVPAAGDVQEGAIQCRRRRGPTGEILEGGPPMIRLLFTSGRGPAESRIAVRKAVAALSAEAASHGLETDCLEGPNTDGHGPASAIVIIHGDAAAAFARPWIGAIQWVAQSPLRPHHKRKNWFIGVFELPALPTAPKALTVQDVRFEAFRAGGPGGQHQNKTESAVRAVHIASGLSVVVREERSQHRNKALALERIAALLKLQGELQAITAQNDAHAAHDRLERGRPVKRFKGTAFQASQRRGILEPWSEKSRGRPAQSRA